MTQGLGPKVVASPKRPVATSSGVEEDGVGLAGDEGPHLFLAGLHAPLRLAFMASNRALRT